MTVLNKIKTYIFGVNDWKTVWDHKGYWSATALSGGSWEMVAKYEIQFSFSRNRYRLKTSGSRPRSHSAYKVAENMLDHFTKQL